MDDLSPLQFTLVWLQLPASAILLASVLLFKQALAAMRGFHMPNVLATRTGKQHCNIFFTLLTKVLVS